MTYRDPLPGGCPPNEAEIITVEKDVFRLVRQIPPTIGDFQSQRTEKPHSIFNVSECHACGLSVFANRRDCARARKLPALRGRHLCRVQLTESAGRIQHTGLSSHHTWWPFRDFDILSHCMVEAP
jgi:hypothetical protein